MKPEEIAARLEIPQEDLSTPVKDEEAGFIYDFINSKSIVKTLETGFAYGKSASYIIAAGGSRHIAIDPFQDKYGRLGIKNIKTSWNDTRIILIMYCQCCLKRERNLNLFL